MDRHLACIRTQDGLSAYFLIKTGVRHGNILSPILFNLVLDWILRNTIDNEIDGIFFGPDCHVADLDYVDELALLQPDEQSMQSTLDTLSEKAAAVGLTIKPSKTKVTTVHCPPPKLLIYNQPISPILLLSRVLH